MAAISHARARVMILQAPSGSGAAVYQPVTGELPPLSTGGYKSFAFDGKGLGEAASFIWQWQGGIGVRMILLILNG